MNNNVTFGDTFAHGFKTGAVVTCLMLVFSICFILIMPEIKEKAMDAAKLKMQKSGTPDAQIETGINIARKFFFVFLVAGILLVDLFLSLIAALIGAGVAKKNPLSPFDQPMI